MAKYRRMCVALSLALGVALGPAMAQENRDRPAADDPSWGLCGAAAAKVEVEFGLPQHILTAVSLAETGRAGPDRQVSTWPWTIHDGTRGYHLNSQQEAVELVRELRAEGRRSIDVGCMQVNLRHHPRAFTSVNEGFEAQANIRYAATFLKSLAAESSSWEEAIAKYHTQNPTLDESYAPKVLTFWARERARSPDLARLTPVGANAQAVRVGSVSTGRMLSVGPQAGAQRPASQVLVASSAPVASSGGAPLVLRRPFDSAR